MQKDREDETDAISGRPWWQIIEIKEIELFEMEMWRREAFSFHRSSVKVPRGLSSSDTKGCGLTDCNRHGSWSEKKRRLADCVQ